MKLLKEVVGSENAIHASIHEEDDNDHADTYFPDNLEESENDFEPLHQHYNNFSEKQKYRLKNFSDDSKDINNFHWKSHHNPEYRDKIYQQTYKKQTAELDSALDKHKTPHEMNVYSGIKYDPRRKKNSEGIVHHPAYLSSSVDKDVAKGFSIQNQENKRIPHILKITVPQGHSGAYIEHISETPWEKEFVLPRGLNLKHVKSTIERDSKHYHVHHMEIVK